MGEHSPNVRRLGESFTGTLKKSRAPGIERAQCGHAGGHRGVAAPDSGASPSVPPQLLDNGRQLLTIHPVPGFNPPTSSGKEIILIPVGFPHGVCFLAA